MSSSTDRTGAERLREATVDLLSRQWRAIGGASSGGPVKKQIDLEALCLASLALEEYESRLWTTMADWAAPGSSLISVQRLRNLASDFPSAQRHVERFAQVAVHDAKDARWRPLLKRGRSASKRHKPRPRQRSAGPVLVSGPALDVRLRAAFGVGVKADLIAFLLGQSFRVTVSTAATALGYTVPPVFRALQDLRVAGLISLTEMPAAAEYAMLMSSWEGVLGGPQNIVRWGYFREVLAYSCAVVAWDATTGRQSLGPYARGALLRELAAAHRPGLTRSGLLDDLKAFPESPDAGEFLAFHVHLASRLERDG